LESQHPIKVIARLQSRATWQSSLQSTSMGKYQYKLGYWNYYRRKLLFKTRKCFSFSLSLSLPIWKPVFNSSAM